MIYFRQSWKFKNKHFSIKKKTKRNTKMNNG